MEVGHFLITELLAAPGVRELAAAEPERNVDSV
jgi:hypothetical protein